MKEALFSGVCTALITPYLGDSINFPMVEILLKRQIDAGIRAVVLCGTTGESAALTDEEKVACFKAAVEYAAGRMCRADTGGQQI